MKPTTDPDAARADLLRLSPYCIHVQSKRAFFLQAPPQQESDLLDASQACWCRHTQTALGPDGEVVDPAACRAGRECFESIAQGYARSRE